MMRFKEKEGVSYNTKQEVTEEHKPSISLLTSGSGLGSGSGSGSRQWSSGLKNNPRIVRASRTFGGKDRHSKVCTIKGLRDRRIRLSVPTAIQLYDLQDRLGLNQPSKVIDWLINSTKDDIDKLPPLPMIPTSFTHHQGYGLPFSSNVISPFFDTNLLSSRKEVMGININDSNYENNMQNNDGDGDEDEDNQSIVAKLKYWDCKQKGLDHNNGHDQGGTSQILAQNLFPIASSTNNSMLSSQNDSQPSFLGNNPMFNYYHLEPSNLSLSQFGNSTQQPSSLSLSSMSQLIQCNSMLSNSSYFPHNHNHNHNHGLFVNSSSSNHHLQQVENEMRAFNRFHLSSNSYSSNSFQNSSGLEMKPFPLSMNHDSSLQHNDEENRRGKNDQSLWKESSGN